MRLALLETRHPNLSMKIKFEEKRAHKSLQTTMQKLGQRKKKADYMADKKGG